MAMKRNKLKNQSDFFISPLHLSFALSPSVGKVEADETLIGDPT
jgi:hypothetical protein